MKQIPDNSPAGWLARVVGAVVSVIVMIGLFFLGLTVFAAVAGLALVVFIVFAARVWWLRRRYMKQSAGNREHARPSSTDDRGVTLEGEFEDRSRRDQ